MANTIDRAPIHEPAPDSERVAAFERVLGTVTVLDQYEPGEGISDGHIRLVDHYFRTIDKPMPVTIMKRNDLIDHQGFDHE